MRPTAKLCEFDDRFTEDWISTDPDGWETGKCGKAQLWAKSARKLEPARLIIPRDFKGLILHDIEMRKAYEGNAERITCALLDNEVMEELRRRPDFHPYLEKGVAHPATWLRARDDVLIWRLRLDKAPFAAVVRGWSEDMMDELQDCCTCGSQEDPIEETRAHVLLECPLYNEARDHPDLAPDAYTAPDRMNRDIKWALGFVPEITRGRNLDHQLAVEDAELAKDIAREVWYARVKLRNVKLAEAQRDIAARLEEPRDGSDQ